MHSTSLEGDESPIAALPPEILLEIFDACRIPADDVDGRVAVLEKLPVRAGPPTIAAVCQRWRDLATNAPTLWTDIHISYPTRRLYSVTTLLHLLLSRSAGRPLSIFVRSYLDGGRVDFAEPVIRTVIEQSTRWARLDMRKCEGMYRLLLSCGGRLPRLRSVRISWGYLSLSSQDSELLHQLFVDCPQLVDVDISGPDLQFPWEQLRRYKVSMAGPPANEALRRTTHARTLRFVAASDSHMPVNLLDNGESPLERRHLKKLTLPSISHLLSFRAPRLSGCHIVEDVKPEEMCILTDYIRTQGIQLSGLSLSLESPDAAKLRVVLVQCPTLRRLQLRLYPDQHQPHKAPIDYNAAGFADVLSILMVRGRQPALLPMLRYLGIMMTCVLSDMASTLFAVVRSRIFAPDKAVVPLQSLSLNVHHAQSMVLANAVSRLRTRLEHVQADGGPTINIVHRIIGDQDRSRRTSTWEKRWTMP
ncbi:hypothetical protein GGG16DRAFT_55385 [Schizophyllum commune]